MFTSKPGPSLVRLSPLDPAPYSPRPKPFFFVAWHLAHVGLIIHVFVPKLAKQITSGMPDRNLLHPAKSLVGSSPGGGAKHQAPIHRETMQDAKVSSEACERLWFGH